MTVVTAPDSDWQKEVITLEQITQYPLVLPAKGYMTSKFVHDLFERHGLSPNIAIEINDIPTLLELVKTGIGTRFWQKLLSVRKTAWQLFRCWVKI
jgi:LysR family cyn operon transcriptional activator